RPIAGVRAERGERRQCALGGGHGVESAEDSSTSDGRDMTANDTTNHEPGTVSVVTGANSGIGRAIAVHLASIGHVVYGTVRSLDKAAKLNAMADAAGVEVKLAVLDVADDESVADGLGRVVDEAGRVDVLVNNAGIGGNGV